MALARQYMTKDLIQSEAPVEFRFAQTQKDYEDVGKFRYEIYKSEADIKLTDKVKREKKILDELDYQSDILIAEKGSEIVGTGRATFIYPTNIGCYAFLEPEKIPLKDKWPLGVATRFCVQKELRGGLLYFKLCEKLVEVALHRGAKASLIYVLDPLKRTLEKLGYQNYMPHAMHPDFGRVNPMYLPLDYASLKARRSPFLRVYRRYQAQMRDIRFQPFKLKQKKGAA